MDIRIEIGRGPEGTHVVKVPSMYERASRRHAAFHWHNGTATLEDIGSTNGTLVNGSRITQTPIKEDDIVWLGGDATKDNRCFPLDVRALFDICREMENTYRIRIDSPLPASVPPTPQPAPANPNRTDYTQEFAYLKKTYIDYHTALSKLKKNANMRMQLPKVLLSMLPALLGISLMIYFAKTGGAMSMGYIAMSLGGVLSGVVGVLTFGRSTSKQEQLSEDILDLQLKYKKEYKCPKCGKEYDLDLHWKKLKSDGKCPYGCGAQFSNNN